MDEPPEGGVGYGRPPKKHRFKPGRSGNPKGRPRGSRNINTLVAEAMEQKITITEDGKRRRVTKGHVMSAQLVNQAVKGDLKATMVVARMQRDAEASYAGQVGAALTHQTEIPEHKYLEALRRFIPTFLKDDEP